MLGDGELQDLSEAFALASQTHVQELLEKYRKLIENYRSLKSDYEEEKEVREKYKRLARGQERNPFVLVLIDGDGYIFRDHLVSARGPGGVSAAQLLRKEIKVCLSRLGSDADRCRVMVRIYANLAGLSNALARAGLAGNEARSLAPFMASFTRSEELFDFVDVGDKKGGTDSKIREMFNLFADSNKCKHIFFAGCHDPGYLPLLTPYRGNPDRITLIRADSFSPDYRTLNLPVVDFSSVFTSTVSNGRIQSPVTEPTLKPTTSENVIICKFFQMGKCRFGDKCNKTHIIDTERFKVFGDWTAQQQFSPELSQVAGSQIDSPSYRQSIAPLLPVLTAETEGLIPVNKNGERLDAALLKPTTKGWDLYKERSGKHKLCNAHHLVGNCPNVPCVFDHNPLEPLATDVMKYILKEYPCPRGAQCRLAKCYYGHLCQRGGCYGGKPCKFRIQFHDVDPEAFEWVSPDDPAEDEGVAEDEDVAEDEGVTDDHREDGSVYPNSTLPRGLAASPIDSEHSEPW